MTKNMKTDMNTWVYLKSDNIADALALATIISYSSETFFIVRRSMYAYVFNGLNNVVMDFFPNTADVTLITIDELPTDSWHRKCELLSEKMGLPNKSVYIPYDGFVKHSSELERIWGEQCKILLYFFPHPDQKLDLIIIDEVVRIFEKKGLFSVSGGTNIMPCIRNTQDLRQLIDIAVICSLKNKISFILTSEIQLKTIGEAIGIKTYVISDINGLAIDNIAMTNANQIANFIETNNKNN